MNRVTLLLLAAVFVYAACGQDKEAPSVQTPIQDETSAKTSTSSSRQINGFDFLTACDSLVVSKLVLTGPNGEGDFAYVMGDCATGKSFELVLVPRTGATPAADFGNAEDVLAKAAKNNYADYICYAFEMPKHLRTDATGMNEIVNLYPINTVVRRLDNNDWVRLGQDRAEDLASYNTLRWKLLHDNMPQYD